MNTENNTELSESLEDYLEALFCIIETRKVARPKDVVNRLHVTNASVTGALRTLARLKLIHYSPHDFISFTEEGARVAGEICHRHCKLRAFLTDIIRVTPEQADSTACKMEHVLSDDIIDRFVRLSQFIKANPEMEKEWIAEFQTACEQKES